MGETKKLSVKRIIALAGACAAFSCGAGFASGQELFQYYTVYGWWMIPGALVFWLVFIFGNYCLAKAGKVTQCEGGTEAISYWLGKVLGAVIDWFTVIYCYLCVIVMMSGSASTLNEQYGLAPWIGALIMCVATAAVVVFGLNGIVDVIAKIGPVLVIVAVLVSVYGLVTAISDGSLAAGMETMKTNPDVVDHAKASEYWWWAGGNLAAGTVLWFTGFMAQLGKKENFKELMIGQSVGLGAVSICQITAGFAFIGAIEITATMDIPFLHIANNIAPWVGTVYAVMIFLAMFSSNCPLLWTSCARIFDDTTKKFKILVVAASAVGYAVAMVVPYEIMMNYVWVIAGDVALGVVAIMLVRCIIGIINGRGGNGAKNQGAVTE